MWCNDKITLFSTDSLQAALDDALRQLPSIETQEDTEHEEAEEDFVPLNDWRHSSDTVLTPYRSFKNVVKCFFFWVTDMFLLLYAFLTQTKNVLLMRKKHSRSQLMILIISGKNSVVNFAQVQRKCRRTLSAFSDFVCLLRSSANYCRFLEMCSCAPVCLHHRLLGLIWRQN